MHGSSEGLIHVDSVWKSVFSIFIEGLLSKWTCESFESQILDEFTNILGFKAYIRMSVIH
jgi:hypothetical protein